MDAHSGLYQWTTEGEGKLAGKNTSVSVGAWGGGSYILCIFQMERKGNPVKIFKEIYWGWGLQWERSLLVFFLTDLFHAVATIKYIFPQAMQNKPGLGEKACRCHIYERMHKLMCQRHSGRTTPAQEVPDATGPEWVGPPMVPCIGPCLGMGHSCPAAPRISRTLSVCGDGVTCLFGSDPPLFFYLLCFSASLWTSSLLLLPIAYLPSILLYDNKSMWVSNNCSQLNLTTFLSHYMKI